VFDVWGRDDRFDLEKVVHVLEASKRFFERRGDGT
jgi:hypothetical protein